MLRSIKIVGYGSYVESTADFVDPGVVEGHPARAVLRGNARRLDVVPHGAVVKAAVGLEWVDGPATLLGEKEELECRAEIGALRRTADVPLATPCHDCWADAQHNGREREGQPEADILLSVDHSNLANQSSDVDEEVEPHVDALDGDGWIHDNTLPRRQRFNMNIHLTKLFHNKRIDIWFKSSSTHSNDENTKN